MWRACLNLTAIFVGLSLLLGVVYQPVSSEGCDLDCLEKKIQDLEDQKQLSEVATTNLEGEVANLAAQIRSIGGQLNQAEIRLQNLTEEIAEREAQLADDYVVMASRVARYYKRSRSNSNLVALFSSNSAAEATREITYQATLNEQDRSIIVTTTAELIDLETDKRNLEADKVQLASLQTRLDQQARFYEVEIARAREFQEELKSQIAELSARQQAIIDARSGSFTFTLGSGELADEYLSSAKGFQESAPNGYFAVFSFGGYSHRNGMSQYGARGRAEAGQSVEEILAYYYPNATLKKDYPVMDQINVDGHGSMPFEDQYLHGIYEVPNSWHENVLKAQVVAARTYAVRRTNNGQSSICTTQACQVFKNERKGGAWEKAVNDTRHWVLVNDAGEPVSTQYSSTSGGFLRTTGWDTTDGGGGSGFLDKAYERKGGSPWLEKSWWRQGYTNSGSTCGRANPWLSPEEMADIVNTHIALNTGGVDTSRITPVTTNCWEGNPYSMSELRDLVKDHGGISSATSVSVSQGNGVTNSVTINGITMSGSDFRRAFNLRAPGHLRIPQYPNTFGEPFFYVGRK